MTHRDSQINRSTINTICWLSIEKVHGSLIIEPVCFSNAVSNNLRAEEDTLVLTEVDRTPAWKRGYLIFVTRGSFSKSHLDVRSSIVGPVDSLLRSRVNLKIRKGIGRQKPNTYFPILPWTITVQQKRDWDTLLVNWRINQTEKWTIGREFCWR